MARKVFAATLLAVSWLSTFFMIHLMVRSKWSPRSPDHAFSLAPESPRHSLIQFGSDLITNKSYFAPRSRYGLIAYAISLILTQTIARTINLMFGLWESDHSRSGGVVGGGHSLHHSIYEINTALTVCCIGSTILVRSWRLRVRYMYYVVLKNSGWSKLMDSSVEDSISFWTKYKAILTSDVFVIAVVFVYISLVALFEAIYSGHHHITKAGNVAAVSLCVGLTLLCLVRLPRREPDYLKEELLLTIHYLMYFTMIDSALMYSMPNWNTYYCISQSLSVLMVFLMGFTSFYWFPLLFRRKARNALESTGRTDAKRLFGVLKNVMCDAKALAAFMDFCCKRYCAENLLALLEIKAYKRCLRESLSSSQLTPLASNSHKHNHIAFPSIGDIGYGLSLVPGDSASLRTEALSAQHSALYQTASKNGKLMECLGEEWTRWDLSFSVRLSQLGCRSSIANGSGDARSKALALCNKYFEWDSEFLLNIGHKRRTKVLEAVGKDVADLEPEQLLFAFDDAIIDVFENLSETMYNFSRIMRQM